VGAMVWAYVVSNVVSYVANMSPATSQFRLSMNALNSYAYDNKLPAAMRHQVRDYFHRTSHLWTGHEKQTCLLRLSPKLQANVIMHVNEEWIKTVSWLRFEDPIFITQLVMALLPEVFVPNEAILYPPALHVIHAGKVIYGGRVLKQNGCWGEDVLIKARHLRNRSLARAITYVEAYFITRDGIFGLAEGFEEIRDRLKRTAVSIAFRRYVTLVARAARVVDTVKDMSMMPRNVDTEVLSEVETPASVPLNADRSWAWMLPTNPAMALKEAFTRPKPIKSSTRTASGTSGTHSQSSNTDLLRAEVAKAGSSISQGREKLLAASISRLRAVPFEDPLSA